MKIINQTQPKSFISQLISKFYKPEVKKNKPALPRPWIGTLFGIPTPEDHQVETEFTPTIEAEVHILLNDLSTVKYKLQNDWQPARDDRYHYPEIGHLINNVAWEYDNAIALTWYLTSIDKVTGERNELPYRGASKAVRVGKLQWCYVFWDGVKGPRFVPSPVQRRNPEAFDEYQKSRKAGN